MLLPWQTEDGLQAWSHRLVLLPDATHLVDASRPKWSKPGMSDAQINSAIAKTATQTVVAYAKAIAHEPGCQKSLVSVRFAGPKGVSSAPSSEALTEIERDIRGSDPRNANILFAAILDLRPLLDLTPNTLQKALDEDAYWDRQRDLVKRIAAHVGGQTHLDLVSVAYDPMADDEHEDHDGVIYAITPHLVVHYYEKGRPARGFYTTPSRKSTTRAGQPETAWLTDYLVRLQASL